MRGFSGTARAFLLATVYPFAATCDWIGVKPADVPMVVVPTGAVLVVVMVDVVVDVYDTVEMVVVKAVVVVLIVVVVVGSVVVNVVVVNAVEVVVDT